MEPTSPPPHRPSSPWRRRLIVTGIFVALGAFAFSQLPPGSYPTDLTRIGQGQAAVVLTMDSHYLEGAAVMTLMHDVRDEFGDSVHFLVASMGRADGQAFAAQHQARDGTVLLFDAQGQRVAVLRVPQTQQELRDAVRDAFGL
jgi:pimeloyl-ACP methyl ester carboxylesterase